MVRSDLLCVREGLKTLKILPVFHVSQFTGFPVHPRFSLPVKRFTGSPVYRLPVLPFYWLPCFQITGLPVYQFSCFPVFSLPVYRFTGSLVSQSGPVLSSSPIVWASRMLMSSLTVRLLDKTGPLWKTGEPAKRQTGKLKTGKRENW